MFSDGGFSSPDIWIVIAINLTAFISILFNPLVFRHNYYKRSSIARDLYMALSMTDFNSCIFLTTTFTIRILRPKEDNSKEKMSLNVFGRKEYLRYERRATLTEKAVGSLTWYLIVSPVIITSFLAICRWYQIKYPLRPFNKTKVEILAAALCFLLGTYFTTMLFVDSAECPTLMKINMQSVYNEMSYGLGGLNLFVDIIIMNFLTSLPCVASILTIWSIVRSETVSGSSEKREKRSKIVSAIKIALLNVGNLLFVGFLISTAVTSKYKSEVDDHNYNLFMAIASCFIPILVSTYNPVIYTLLTRGMLTINSRVGRNPRE